MTSTWARGALVFESQEGLSQGFGLSDISTRALYVSMSGLTCRIPLGTDFLRLKYRNCA